MNEQIKHPGYSSELGAFLKGPHRPFINGAFVDPATSDTFTVDDPATGKVIATVPDCGAADIDQAVKAARAALSGPWAEMRPVEREKLMLDLADAIERDAGMLAQIESVEQGKALGMARALGIGGAVDWVRYYAGWATKIEGSTIDTSIAVPPGAKHFAATIKEPVGVVGAIVPWNFPFLIAVWKIAPALACGCTIVLKPAEETPLGALYLAKLCAEVGIPPGVVNIVTGLGKTAGAAIAHHPDIDKLTFTGSTEVGKIIGHAAVDHMKRFTLELGGHAPMILFSDMEENAEPLLAGLGMFFNQGQVCTSARRILIQRSVFDRTLENLAKVADSLSFGSGLDETAQINPVVSSRHLKELTGFIERAEKEGARRVAGKRPVLGAGYYVAPTIFTDIKPTMEIARDEVFGPVVAAIPFDDVDEAIRIANDTRYGLSASVWTKDLTKAFKVAKAVKAGTVWVNTHNTVDPNAPFGGYGQSGIGREHGRAVLDAYLETKTLIMRYA